MAPAWLLLITNLPGHNPTLRMRIWRALKAAGAGLLRDGAYLLPNGERAREVLEEQGAEIKAAGGLVQVLSFDAESAEQNAELVALFDRTDEYAEAIKRLDALKGELAKLAEPEARQRLAALIREVAAIAARDFFPGEPRKQMEGALADGKPLSMPVSRPTSLTRRTGRSGPATVRTTADAPGRPVNASGSTGWPPRG